MTGVPTAVVALVFGAGPFLILLAAAWVVGSAAERAAPNFGLSRPAVAELTPVLVVVAIAGARLAALLPHWQVTVAHPLDLLRVTDHLSLVGGAIAGLGALVVFARRAHLPLRSVADLYGAALPLGVAVHGLGCVLRSDCYGRAAPPPFGIVFPGLETARYPVELYAAAAALVTYAVLQRLRRRCAPGAVALTALTSLAATRAGLDVLRLRAEDSLPSGDQLMSLAAAATGGLLLLAVLVRHRWRPQPRPTVIASRSLHRREELA